MTLNSPKKEEGVCSQERVRHQLTVEASYKCRDHGGIRWKYVGIGCDTTLRI